MNKKLTEEQRAKIALALYDHVSGILPFQAQILEGFAEHFQTTVKYTREIVKARRPIQDIHARWLIKKVWSMVSGDFIREVFDEITQDSPEAYGFEVSLKSAETLKFEKWQKGELLQRAETV